MGAAMSETETVEELRRLIDRASRRRECAVCETWLGQGRRAFCSSDCKNAYRRRRRAAQKRAAAATQEGERA